MSRRIDYGMRYTDERIRAAYAECRRLARRHYENFPVASRLAPGGQRDALAAVYAFARYADDLADEPGVERRLEKLAAWRELLRECFTGEVRHPVFLALQDSARRFHLSFDNFENLLRAFESDLSVNRHRDFSSLLAYCSCSANPVGRLVLELFGHREPELMALSDCICTALQLANFWQDVAVDLERDRIYLPLEDLECFSYTLDDLRGGRVDERWRELLKLEIGRTRALFEQGRALPERVAPELRRQLRLTWLGGMSVLRKIESAGYDVFRHRPALSKLDFLRLYFRARHAFPVGMGERAPAITGPPGALP
jgi:phytoene synthase